MRLVVQRVSGATVRVEEKVVGAIGRGLLVLVGVTEGDGEKEIAFLAEKLVHLRIFVDDEEKMNRSVLEVGGGILVVSQFTLYGDCRKGRRPSFVDAAVPAVAIPVYETFVDRLRRSGLQVETGIFGAMMQVELVNDGPVTLIIDSPR